MHWECVRARRTHDRDCKNKQFGFRRGKSTEEAVNSLLTQVSNDLDGGKAGVGVFLDLAKAFDTVSITILLRKLEKTGIRGEALKWFTSYLTERQQVVKISGHTLVWIIGSTSNIFWCPSREYFRSHTVYPLYKRHCGDLSWWCRHRRDLLCRWYCAYITSPILANIIWKDRSKLKKSSRIPK